MQLRRFYASPDQFSDGEFTLSQDETRHLRDVLRLKVGYDANVFDGEGKEFSCVIRSIDKRSARLEIISETTPSSPESPLDITVAAVLIKADKFDQVVQKCVELGVNQLVPLTSVRCEVKIRNEATKAERWRKIALDAAKQSGRARLPVISAPLDFAQFADQTEPSETIMFSERDGILFDDIKAVKRITAIFGPEGGWDDAELQLARDKKFGLVTFGGRIMRADTAAIGVTAILQHRFGDIN